MVPSFYGPLDHMPNELENYKNLYAYASHEKDQHFQVRLQILKHELRRDVVETCGTQTLFLHQ